MSRVSNALNMYFLLQSRNIMTGRELSEILEVSTRMVNEYKQDLEMAGIYIGSKRGRYGGYYLENEIDLRKVYLTDSEKDALGMVKEIVKSEKQPYSLDFEIAMNKIMSSTGDQNNTHFVKTNNKSFQNIKKERDIMLELKEAVEGQKKVIIKYSKIGKTSRVVEDRVIHPYNTFNYNNGVYIAGFCEKSNDFRYFRLNRILDYKITRKKFNYKDGFNLKEIINKSFGISNDRKINLKCLIKYPYSEFVKENTYSSNQEIEELEDGSIIYKGEMTGYREILNWIKSMGSSVKVIEPKELKEDILKDLKETLGLYESFK